jgi:Flp pilus assembly protein TadD
LAWSKKGEYDNAIADFSTALGLNPKYAGAYNGRGIAWYQKGQYDKAIADYTQALQLAPANSETYNNRGVAWKLTGQYDKAIADFTQALQLNPQDASCYNNLAWLQATCPDARYRDGKKALANAAKACQLDGGKNWNYLSTMAAACAENGDFDTAADWQTKAIALAAEASGAEQARARLQLYKANKPYREDATK